MFTLPELGYEFSALDPHIDAKTMEIHHDKHHATYVDKLNAAVKGTDLENKTIEEILKDLNIVPEDIRTAVRNNGGGHHNHTLFWESMKPGGASKPSGDLANQIDSTFGSFEDFKSKVAEAAVGRFGSGWLGWLKATTN